MKLDQLDKLSASLPNVPGLQAEEYFTSVVLLLLVPVDDEYHILFEKRASSIRQGGEISFPGGRRDKSDASMQETALRETAEEVGIPAGRIRLLGRLDSVFAPMGALVHVFVGVTDVDPDEIKINPREVEKAFLIPVSYFKDNSAEVYSVITEVHPRQIDPSTGEELVLFPAEELGLPERYWNKWGGFKHKIFVYRAAGETIWGLTARILVDFTNHIPDSHE